MNTYEVYTAANADVLIYAECTGDAHAAIRVHYPEIHAAGYSLRKVS